MHSMMKKGNVSRRKLQPTAHCLLLHNHLGPATCKLQIGTLKMLILHAWSSVPLPRSEKVRRRGRVDNMGKLRRGGYDS